MRIALPGSRWLALVFATERLDVSQCPEPHPEKLYTYRFTTAFVESAHRGVEIRYRNRHLERLYKGTGSQAASIRWLYLPQELQVVCRAARRRREVAVEKKRVRSWACCLRWDSKPIVGQLLAFVGAGKSSLGCVKESELGGRRV